MQVDTEQVGDCSRQELFAKRQEEIQEFEN